MSAIPQPATRAVVGRIAIRLNLQTTCGQYWGKAKHKPPRAVAAQLGGQTIVREQAGRASPRFCIGQAHPRSKLVSNRFD